MNNRKKAIEIFLSGVESVKPGNLISSYVALQEDILIIKDLSFDLSLIKRIFLIGAGKASAGMAFEMESILGERISEGHIITKYGHVGFLKYTGTSEAGHPIPDENGLKGTEKILAIARKAEQEDLVICLISGGGSALMTDVPEGCTLSDLKVLNDVLLRSGADIQEMNCIRKHLSKVKGGHLAKTISPAPSVSLILSDVIGDPLDVIASGPTAPDPTTFADALAVVKKYKIESLIPARINQYLLEGQEGKHPETMKANNQTMRFINNVIIGNNTLALNEAAKKAQQFDYHTRILTYSLEGETEILAKEIVQHATKFKIENKKEKICLLFGGEPTIKINGNGLGGRNQHLTLIAAKLLKNSKGITILSGGTDGTDGPTDAAGAVCDYKTCQTAQKLQLDIDTYIEEYNSYAFFKQAGGLIITGPTFTNVMDIIVVLIN